jgi:hypothetical protein
MSEFDCEGELDDVVLFELPTLEDVEVFADAFRPRFAGWVDADVDFWIFAVDLTERPDDLPCLLREAQGLLAELALPVIRFYLDSRVYVLQAARSAPAATVAA